MNEERSPKQVAILMGSKSDIDRMRGAWEVLEEFGVRYEVKILSAHRSPERTAQYAKEAETRGFQVLIAGAGAAAHLAGALVAHTCLPVIGVPLASSSLGGMDALLATVQMPKGVPVATVAINGSSNAGLLAVQILAIGDDALRQRLTVYKRKLTEDIQECNNCLDPGKLK